MSLKRNAAKIFNENNEVKPRVLRSCLSEHAALVPRYRRLLDYYDGKQAILKRERDGVNTRIVCNLPEYITDFATSYFMGNPVTYTFTDEDRISADEALMSAYRRANVDKVDIDLCRIASKCGVAVELVYQNAAGETASAAITPDSAFIVTDDTVEQAKLFGVHYYDLTDEDNRKVGRVVNVYTSATHYTYHERRGELKLVEAHDNLFGAVPMIEYRNKANLHGDYESVLSLVDAYNTLQSDRINDKVQFVDALLVVYGVLAGDSEGEKLELVRALKRMGLLEMPSGSRAEYIAKSFNETEVEILKNSLVSDIHKISKVPNLTDEHFAGNSSGVAMRYKLMGLEQLAKTKESYYRIGLRQRMDLYAAILRLKLHEVDVDHVQMGFTRSLPVNEVEVAGTVNSLRGLVSDETLLAQLPFVSDVKAELDKVQAQNAERIRAQQVAFGSYDQSDDEAVDE